MKTNFIISMLVVILIGLIGVWFFVFFKPTHFKRDVSNETGISLTASSIVTAYKSNEVTANAEYLDKPLQITGEIAETKADQIGKTTLLMKSNDAFTYVFCTLKTTDTSIKKGDIITVKGICTGFLSDVVLRDAIVVK